MNYEIERFIKVWISAISCLCYCYYIPSRIPKGFLRLLSVLPIFYLFIILPFNLSSPILVGYTAFFLSWLGTFKVLLFSFNQGPLALISPNILHFISIASLPINPNQNNTQNPKLLLLLMEVLILAMMVRVYDYKENLHPHFILVLYCCYIYLALELVLLLIATTFRIVFGFELEPHFNKPFLSTSLQNFWGRRWNLMATRILRPTVYHPVRRMSTSFVGPSSARSIAMLTTFFVSGLMHELIYYYLIRAPPTWEITWFFVLHGVCTTIEVEVKKVMTRRGWLLHRAVSRMLVLVFLGATAKWLFFPPLLRNGVIRKGVEECVILADFVNSKLRIITCV